MSTELQYALGETPTFAFCESIHAGGRSLWHIRRISPQVGLRLTGGVDSPCLCGHVTRGWDLNVRILPRHVEPNAKVVSEKCLALYLEATKDVP